MMLAVACWGLACYHASIVANLLKRAVTILGPFQASVFVMNIFFMATMIAATVAPLVIIRDVRKAITGEDDDLREKAQNHSVARKRLVMWRPSELVETNNYGVPWVLTSWVAVYFFASIILATFLEATKGAVSVSDVLFAVFSIYMTILLIYGGIVSVELSLSVRRIIARDMIKKTVYINGDSKLGGDVIIVGEFAPTVLKLSWRVFADDDDSGGAEGLPESTSWS
ncbi:hypothetical protein PanWU01x14_077680 [Parasponia andersonii]|uniref:Uncharacterized protein n=1 Tax=Parasponia andersonii TaxID=3476 RepID=A0A2P5DBU0_PARAD|nr:hypothetical protein PanWU01x14_077680 [Parasponia andersonii]